MKAMKFISGLVSFLAGLVLYAYQIIWFKQWWGTLGLVLGICLPPATIAFPFIYLVKVEFSSLFFTTWGIMVVAGIVKSIFTKEKKCRHPECDKT